MNDGWWHFEWLNEINACVITVRHSKRNHCHRTPSDRFKLFRMPFSRGRWTDESPFSESSLYHFNMKNFIIQSTDKFTIFHEPFTMIIGFYGCSSNSMIRIMFRCCLLCGWTLNVFVGRMIVWPNFWFINASNWSMAVGGWWPSIFLYSIEFHANFEETSFECGSSLSAHSWNAVQINQSNYYSLFFYVILMNKC